MTRSAPLPARRAPRLTLPEQLLSNESLRSALSLGFDFQPGPPADSMALTLANAFGSSALGVIHYGSQARGVDARADSAYDFFVIVDDYRAAYNSLTSSMDTGVSARTATALAHVLSPSVHAIPPVPDGGRRNKCGVLTITELERAASLRALDHFVVGRLFQHVQILWSRDSRSEASIRNALIEMRARTFEWGRSFLPEQFTVEEYGRSLLATSFAGEIRPEAPERSAQLFEAQNEILVPVYTALLDGLVNEGILSRNGDVYRQVEQPTPLERRRWQRYFRVSKARGTARWGKAVVLYDGWLEYIVQKIARHNNVDVELTERERRWPFIFLWPKVFLFFRERSRWEPRK